MAVNFFVEPQKLVQTATAFQSSCTTWNSTITQMINLVNSIGCSWAGPAADAYKRRFAQHDQDRRDIVSLINEHVNDLRQIAQNYNVNENQIQSNANSLRTNVVH